MQAPNYVWENYAAINAGETRFSARNHNFHTAAAQAADHICTAFDALEFGTAQGAGTKYFLENYPGMRLTTIDVDVNALETARKDLEPYNTLYTVHNISSINGMPDRNGTHDSYKETRIEFINGNFLEHETPRRYFMIFGLRVTHNFDDAKKQAFIQKSLDLLVPDGMLVLGDVVTYGNDAENAEEWQREYAYLDELGLADRMFWKTHFDTYDKPLSSPLSWYEQTLKDTGFKDVRVPYRDGFWTIMTAIKEHPRRIPGKQKTTTTAFL